ncbi:MAG: heparan-alpha-glucosaminide N-acetyltransferase domain-containing protein [Candidatus Ozemobacteraceae bacterium]
MAENTVEVTEPVVKPPRIISVDALRGFDMFWIIGADEVIAKLTKLGDYSILSFLGKQFEHKDWAGFAFYDLIFPLFIFIMGASMVLSLKNLVEREDKIAAMKRIFFRSLIMFGLGVMNYGGFTKLWPEIRLLGVLQRIAICYFVAGIMFCYFRPRSLGMICAGTLVAYWGVMAWVPFPDVRPADKPAIEICRETGFDDTSTLNFNSTKFLQGTYIKGVNLSNYLDQRFLPGHKWDGSWDPEGLLSTFPAICTCILGAFAGFLLINRQYDDWKKIQMLLLWGTISVAVGWLWNINFPVIKKIWTSSYVLVAAGYSAWLLAAFYYIIEMRRWQKWATPFLWIGTNSITIYVISNLFELRKVALCIVGGDVKNLFDRWIMPGFGSLAIEVVTLSIGVLLCRFLYQRKIFLKI